MKESHVCNPCQVGLVCCTGFPDLEVSSATHQVSSLVPFFPQNYPCFVIDYHQTFMTLVHNSQGEIKHLLIPLSVVCFVQEELTRILAQYGIQSEVVDR